MIIPEAMMSGLPVIAAHNTGHRDSAPAPYAIPLLRQAPVTLPCPLFTGMDGWGECDPAEVVEALIRVRQMSDDEREAMVGPAAAWSTKTFGWQAQAKKFHDLLLTFE